MHLKTVHIVFVTCATLLAALFGGWGLAQPTATLRALGAVSLLAAVTLPIYGRWFWHKITTPGEDERRRRKLLHSVPFILAASSLAWPRGAAACSACFGAAEGPMIDSARASVLFLLAIVVVVQIALGAFALYLRRRALRASDPHFSEPPAS